MDVLTPEARIVAGHPMITTPIMKQTPGQPPTPVMQADGVTPATETYIGVAIPKSAETDWKLTPWGQLINIVAQSDWPNGEYLQPTFAWKVVDGDSVIPNKSGKRPCDKESYPGHWVINCSTRLTVRCFHVGKYDPLQQIQNKNEIKTGDYCRVALQVKGNNPSQSPGVYINPTMVEITRPGAAIQTGPSAADVFGGAAAAAPTPTPAAVQPPVAATTPTPTPAAEPVKPHPDFLNPQPPAPQSYNVQGTVYTKEQLLASGWTEEQIATQATPV